MSKKTSIEPNMARANSEVVGSAKGTTESLETGRSGFPVDPFLDHATLCYAYRNSFIHPQLSMLEALSQRMCVPSPQIQMTSFVTSTNLPSVHSYFPNVYEFNGMQSSLQIHPENSFLRRKETETSEHEYSKFMRHVAERQLLRNASTRIWSQSVQRHLVSEGTYDVQATAYRSDAPSTWDSKPSASTGSCRNPTEAMGKDDQPLSPRASKKSKLESERFSSSGEHDHIDNSKKPAAAMKQDEKPPSTKAAKDPKVDSRWLISLNELRQYKRANGHTIVPRGYCENPKLASWVAEQRKQYRLLSNNKQSSMTKKRIDQLNDLGFIWHAQEEAWMRQFNDLRRFYEEHGHCNVPIREEGYPKLGLWVKEQRRHYALRKRGKPSHLSEERYHLLNTIDFCYDAHNTTWLKHFHQLERCQKEHGSCVIPTNQMDPRLVTWMNYQRRQYRKRNRGEQNHINAERIEALNKIGFVWSPRANALNDDEISSSSNSKSPSGSISAA